VFWSHHNTKDTNTTTKETPLLCFQLNTDTKNNNIDKEQIITLYSLNTDTKDANTDTIKHGIALKSP
jgi:hypothetical protein